MTWRLDPAKTGVLILDVQQRLVPAIHDQARVVKKVVDLLAVAEIFGLPLFVTEQVPEKLGPTAPEIDLKKYGATPIPKSAFSAASVLPPELPKTVLVAGIETHICVRQTVYDLRLGDRNVCVIGDAVGSRSPLDHQLALDEMRHDQVLILSVESLAWELAGSADSPAFKRLLPILK